MADSRELMAVGFDPYSDVGELDDTQGLFSAITKAVGGAVKAVGHGISSGAKAVAKGANAVANVAGKVPIIGQGLKGIVTLAASPLHVTAGIVSGARLDKVALGALKAQISGIKDIAPYAQTVISFVPGIGQGVAGAIGAGLALAEGRPITEALIEGVKGALPGGPLAKAAFSLGESAIKGHPIDRALINALPVSDQQKKLIAAGLSTAKAVVGGQRVDKALLDNAINALPGDAQKAVQIGMALAHGQVLQAAGQAAGVVASKVSLPALPNVQRALSATPLGKVASGALSAMGPHLSGSSLAKVGLNAAAGATPQGITKALSQLSHIKNPSVQAALKNGLEHFVPGSSGALGYGIGARMLKVASRAQNPKGVLATARRALGNEAQRRAFDSAVGTVARASLVSKPVRNVYGVVSNPIPIPLRRREIGVLAPDLNRAFVAASRNPILKTAPVAVLAARAGVSQQVAARAQRLAPALPWHPLSPAATRHVVRHSPFSSFRSLTDTQGLSPDGLVYVVEKGDYPGLIAKKLTGLEKNWPQLIAANPQKPTVASNIGKVFKTLVTGEKLKVPATWQKPVVSVSPTTAQPVPSASSTAPIVVVNDPARQNTAAILQGKGILVTWSKTDGSKFAGFQDYGARPEDVSPAWGERDQFMGASFADWSNRNRNTRLNTSGELTPELSGALRAWAEAQVISALPPPPPPAATAEPVTSPGIPQLPANTLPAVLGGGASVPAPTSAPVVVDLPDMTIAETAPPPKPAAKSGGSIFWPVVGGIVGGLAGGPVGAAAGVGAGIIVAG